MALVAAVNTNAPIFGVSVLFLIFPIGFARHRIPSPTTRTIFIGHGAHHPCFLPPGRVSETRLWGVNVRAVCGWF